LVGEVGSSDVAGDQGFEVTVRGSAGPTVRAALSDLEVEVTLLGKRTLLRAPDADQAALFGLLQRIQDMGLEVIDVRRYEDP
jgi:hypothetical protein